MKSISQILFLIIMCSLSRILFAQQNYWSSTNWSGSSGYVYDIACDSSDRIYAVTYDDGIYLTSDKGNTWTNLNVPANNFTCITISKSDDIYVGTWGDGMYGSTNQGATWNKFSLPATQINRIALGTDQTIYVATFADFAVYRSDDNGNSWIPINQGIEFDTIPFDSPSIAVGSNGKVYMLTITGKVYVSSNKGDNWTDMNFPLDDDPMTSDDNIITLFTSVPGYVFVAGSRGVTRYTESSQAWDKINTGVQQPYLFVRALAVTKEGYLLRGSNYSYSGTVYLSKDNGDHWINRSQGLPSESIFGFAIDSKGNIFAATYGKGVFISNPQITSVYNYKNGIEFNFQLKQNYPNPFNPTTKINYSIPQRSFVTIKIYNLLGTEVAILVAEEKLAGSYEVEFNGSKFSSGVYFYSIQAGSFTETKKFILLK